MTKIRERGRLGRPTASSSENTHDRIVRAAQDVFARRGFAGAQIREIAEAAGVTSSALYNYFNDKLSIYVAVFRDAERRLAERLREATSTEVSTAARLAAFVRESRRFYEEDPTALTFLAGTPVEMRNDREVFERIIERPVEIDVILRDTLVAGQQRGEVDKNTDIEGAVAMFSAITLGIALYSTFGEEGAYERLSVALEAWMGGNFFHRIGG